MSSSESSTILVKARPVLSDMPDKIKEMIAENTDVKTRYTLRKVSTHFRAAVDTSKFYFQAAYVELYGSSLIIQLIEGKRIEYRKNGENGCVVKKEEDEREKVIEGEDYIQRAVDDLTIILKSPRVSVEWLKLTNYCDENTNIRLMHCLQDKFGNFRHKLSVRKLTAWLYTNQDQVLGLLGFVRPGILKNLILLYLQENCNRIVETEHWPFLEKSHVGDVQGVPISKFLHLRRFTMRAFPLTKDAVEQIVQSILQRPDNFEKYEFGTIDDEMFPIWKEAMSNYWPARSTVPIPGTNNELSINYREDIRTEITFRKTIRRS